MNITCTCEESGFTGISAWKLNCFSSLTLSLKSPLVPEAAADDYLTRAMTALFHGPPTRGLVMNFYESETPSGQKKKKKSRSARCCLSPAHVYPAEEPRARRAAFRVDYATPYVTGFVPTNRSRAAPKRAPKKGTPLDQSEQRSLGAYTQRHMARLRCPCERARGSGTLLLCQM